MPDEPCVPIVPRAPPPPPPTLLLARVWRSSLQYWQFVTKAKVQAQVRRMDDQQRSVQRLQRRRASVELVTMNQREYGQLYSRAVRVLSPDLDDGEVDTVVQVRPRACSCV